MKLLLFIFSQLIISPTLLSQSFTSGLDSPIIPLTSNYNENIEWENVFTDGKAGKVNSGLVDSEGNIQKWNMLQRWNLKDVQLPNLDNVSGAAGSLSNLLRRRDAWKSLNEIVKDIGENLGLYNLRYR